MKKPSKDYLNMTAEEIAEETRDLDNGSIPPGKPLSSDQRAKWERARSGGTKSIHVGPGRPKVGEGAVPVPVSVEGALLRRAIANARKLKLKRSEYFSKALQLLTDGQAEVAGVTVKAVATVTEKVKR
jgi:hypothetical protein